MCCVLCMWVSCVVSHGFALVRWRLHLARSLRHLGTTGMLLKLTQVWPLPLIVLIIAFGPKKINSAAKFQLVVPSSQHSKTWMLLDCLRFSWLTLKRSDFLSHSMIEMLHAHHSRQIACRWRARGCQMPKAPSQDRMALDITGCSHIIQARCSLLAGSLAALHTAGPERSVPHVYTLTHCSDKSHSNSCT